MKTEEKELLDGCLRCPDCYAVPYVKPMRDTKGKKYYLIACSGPEKPHGDLYSGHGREASGSTIVQAKENWNTLVTFIMEQRKKGVCL